jgi:hypothetical protein
LETISNSSQAEEAAIPAPKRVSESPEFPTAEAPREESEKRGRGDQPLSEGSELDNASGKTTRGDGNGVDGDRLVSDAESRKMDAELRKMAQAETRRRHEASENERRLFAECQELVDAGLASWIVPPPSFPDAA